MFPSDSSSEAPHFVPTIHIHPATGTEGNID